MTHLGSTQGRWLRSGAGSQGNFGISFYYDMKGTDAMHRIRSITDRQ